MRINRIITVDKNNELKYKYYHNAVIAAIEQKSTNRILGTSYKVKEFNFNLTISEVIEFLNNNATAINKDI